MDYPYLVYFSISSSLFLMIIAGFYLQQKHLPILRSRVYRLMLMTALFATLMDTLAIVLETHADTVAPHWIIGTNICLLLAVQTTPYIFCRYTAIITGYFKRFRWYVHTLLTLPYVLNILNILSSAFGNPYGAFSVDATGIFHRGMSYGLMYWAYLFYFVLACVFVLLSHKSLVRKHCVVIYIFVLIATCALLVQYLYPAVLLNTSAHALAVIMLYCSLELPSDHIDGLTGAFNRNAASIILDAYYQERKPFCLIFFSLREFKLVNLEFGIQVGDMVLKRVSEKLAVRFPYGHIFRSYGDVFGVILQDIQINRMYLESMFDEFPTVWEVGESRIKLSCHLAAIRYTECESAEDIFIAMDNVLAFFRNNKSHDWFLADASFFLACEQKREIEKAVERAIKNNSIQMVYQPIHNGKNRVLTLESLARLTDETLGVISPDVFIQTAENNGSILKLGEQIFRKVCRFIRDNSEALETVDYVSVNLSMAQCMKENIARDLLRIVREFGIDPHKICLEITETASTTSFSMVRRMMEQFETLGFRFSLDDFGTGYANFQYISELPFTNVKLDKSLLWSAMDNTKRMNLLRSISKTMQSLELKTICEGVETQEQIDVLEDIGITIHQGYFYSKPLPESELICYLSNFPLTSTPVIPS